MKEEILEETLKGIKNIIISDIRFMGVRGTNGYSKIKNIISKSLDQAEQATFDDVMKRFTNGGFTTMELDAIKRQVEQATIQKVIEIVKDTGLGEPNSRQEILDKLEEIK